MIGSMVFSEVLKNTPEKVARVLESDDLPSKLSRNKEINSLPSKLTRENITDVRNCPLENGHWEGERGNSKWIPDPYYAPQKSNPEGKTWEEILEKYDVDGIEFKDGEPIFDNISKATVKIEGFSSNRDDNFDKADIELAKQRGCLPEEVKQWRKENGYTWHECKDMATMQKVPSEVHNNIPHRGGVSNLKSLES